MICSTATVDEPEKLSVANSSICLRTGLRQCSIEPHLKRNKGNAIADSLCQLMEGFSKERSLKLILVRLVRMQRPGDRHGSNYILLTCSQLIDELLASLRSIGCKRQDVHRKAI